MKRYFKGREDRTWEQCTCLPNEYSLPAVMDEACGLVYKSLAEEPMLFDCFSRMNIS